MTQIEDLKLDTRPLYVRVEEALIKLVADCEAGDQLPPEAELAQHLGVSRATLREALRALEERDMIVRRHGVGTFVASPQPFLIKSGLEALESLDTLAARMGLDCGTDNLSINRETVPSHLAVKLHVPVSSQVIIVSRTRITNNKVVAYMDDVVPASIISLNDIRDNFKGSVLDYLVEIGISIAYAWTNIKPVYATEELAQYLQVPKGTMLLLLEETLYTADNQIVDYSRNYFVAGSFQFHVIRRMML